MPVTLERLDARHWRGRARLSLASLRLEESDSVVYRALVRHEPRGRLAPSDAFPIESAAGSSSPAQALRCLTRRAATASVEQMVIVKTERLQADRRDSSPELWTERSGCWQWSSGWSAPKWSS